MQPNLQDIVVGGVAKISLIVKNPFGVLTDPTALRLIVKPPVGVNVIYTFGVGNIITKNSIGQYSANITMTSAGGWAYRWESDAPNAGADEGRISVKKSLVL